MTSQEKSLIIKTKKTTKSLPNPKRCSDDDLKLAMIQSKKGIMQHGKNSNQVIIEEE
ncbi:hypothetical protein [Sessilibacter corallicola]|uniref:Uncharacterized protein n=1 Tax=Sessilibacter corallicola TaxID=2904075 RepID=A0ABQ0A7F2_9GAMM